MNLDSNRLRFRAGRRLSGIAAFWIVGVAAWCAGPLPAAEAREVRVATYNILFGTGAVGSPEYDALEAVLERMDADVVCFQELYATTYANWTNLAAELGYPYTAMGGNNPSADSLFLGYFSRFPILSTHAVQSPPGANELTRLPFRAVIDVPDAAHPLVLWTMHHKASSGSLDKFRRAIEAKRICQDVDAYLEANPDHVEYVLTGDMNDDIRDAQTPAQFASQPSGAPSYYVLGSDIAFPVAYATFPTHRYAPAGAGLIHMPAVWEDSTIPITRPASGRQLDYVFLSPALMASPLGAPQSEVYYSEYDMGGGLPKVGVPLPFETSTNASDHLPIFVDIQMADNSSVLPMAGFAFRGEAGGPFAPDFETFVLTETNDFDTAWTLAADVEWLGLGETRVALAPFDPYAIDVFPNENAATLPPGVYEGTVTFLNETTGQQETRAVSLTIRDYLEVSPSEGLAAQGTIGGPFSPASKSYVVTNKSALSVSFTANAAANWLTVAPANWTLNAGEAAEVTVSINANAAALPIGSHEDEVVITDQTTGLIQARPASLNVFGPLCDAVDRCDLVWTTGGDADWFYQTDVAADGVDAAQSGPISTSQQTWMETVVAGPARVGFRWKTSSRSTHYLRFYANGSSLAYLSGESDWTERSFDLAAGVQTLRWAYATSTYEPQGTNAGWVDQVVLHHLTASPSGTWYANGIPGGPFAPADQAYVLTNSGPISISWGAAPSADWISIDPVAGVLEPGSSVAVAASLSANTAVLPGGSYSGAIAFSNFTTGDSFARQVLLNIQDFLVISPSYLLFQGFPGGPYAPETDVYSVSNSGAMAVDWSVSCATNWVTVAPTNGTLAPGAVAEIVVSVNANANGLPFGWNEALLSFSNATTQLAQWRGVYLEMKAALAVAAPGWTPTGPVGGPFAPASAIFALTNQSPAAQNWRATASAAWLSLEPAAGELAGNASVSIVAAVNAAAAALPLGEYSAAIVFSNVATGARMTQTVWLAAGIVFCEAIEACDLDWTFGGHAPWRFQTDNTQDGVDAAASGTIANSQESWMQTTVVGPGTLSFGWAVSSESNWDYLEFWIDGIRTNRISGTVDWQTQSYVLGSGPHALRWRYVKDGSVSNGSDKGWVDLVAWTPGRTAMGVPISWYEGFGLAPGAEETWDDLDWRPAAAGDPHWFQYFAGLDPNDPAERFQILAIDQVVGQPTRLEWWGGTHGPAAPYVIESTIDMEFGPWSPVGASPRAPGVNVWTNAEPAEALRFYRVRAAPEP